MRLLFLASLACLLLAPASAAAVDARACTPGEPHVAVSFEEGFGEEMRTSLIDDLAASLKGQKIETCQGRDKIDGTLALVELSRTQVEGEATEVRISVNDFLTRKEVTRSVELRNTRDGSEGLLLAVATDELLRATWAELSLRRNPEPVETDREAAQETAKPETESAAALPKHRLGVRVALDHYFSASTLMGADLSYGSSLADLLEWSVALGPRFGLNRRRSEQGRTRVESLAAEVSLGWPLLRSERMSLGPQIATQVSHAWFSGDADEGQRVENFTGWAVTLRGGASMRWLLGPMYLQAESSLGVPVLAVTARDEQGVVGGISGLEWSSALSAGGWWGK